ncbi:Cobalt-zinc-cadmium resistance protein CzcC [Massilia sp. Bi118]|jgi:cobalt-zinc-cadmium efflux system outer membrane protein|uniref:TolC family protein n=1 Tax=Massilia sp. Bi118 TaxID=2822346 RepID=UPI001DA86A3C|nr:TolC family protein [Massilia sp. Bi118]CAH0196465.1 Cobalt-zinc-cadmium resistance protein CzcC [Massilia sp. Bi118]
MQSKHFVLGATVFLLQTAFPVAHAIGQQNPSSPAVMAPQATNSALPLTLNQAIELALSANPALRSATRSIGIADGAVQQASARPNPELSFLSEGTDRNTRTETTQVNQRLELGGKRAARIAAAEQERNVAIDDVNARRAELRADVITAYMDALTAQERLALARASLDLAHKSTEVTSRRVIAGKISPVEQTRSSVAEAAAQLELTQAEAELALAQRRLTALWASPRPLDQPLQAPDTFDRVPAWTDLAQRLETAPQLRRAQSNVAGRDAQVRLERAQRIPDVTVTVGSQREREQGRTQGVIGLSVPLPLFNRNQGNVLSALRRADQARDDLEAERLRLTQALADAYQRAEVASTQTVTLRDQVLPAAQSAYDAAVTGFSMGKFAFTDVLDAQRTLFQTKTQYLRALADRYRSIADIERYVPLAGAGVNPIERQVK